jgi:ferritin-like metal-binding protein YciE
MLRLTIPGKTSDIGDIQRREYFLAMLRSSLKSETELRYLLQSAYHSASTSSFKELLHGYSIQVCRQAIRFEEIFGILLMQAEGSTFAVLRNLQKEIKALKELVNKPQQGDRQIRDSLLKINQHKIALYDNLGHLSVSLGMNDITWLLHEALDEEKATGFLLTVTGRNHIKLRMTEV